MEEHRNKDKTIIVPECLFEDHFFNSKTGNWELIDGGALRRCLHSKCTRKHKLANRPTQICPREDDCPDAGVTCFLLHNNDKIQSLCRWGKECIDIDCVAYRHPSGRSREVCTLRDSCPDAMIACFKLHDMIKLVPLCHYRQDCVNFMCTKRHPPGRREICDYGAMCWRFITGGETECLKLHPKILQKACRWDSPSGGQCKLFGCPFVHAPESPIDCPYGNKCPNVLSDGPTRCLNKHPLMLR